MKSSAGKGPNTILRIGLACVIGVPLVAQSPQAGTALGSGIGGALGDATAAVLMRALRTPANGTLSAGPKVVRFHAADDTEPALNLLVITNGVAKPVQVTTVEVKGRQFAVEPTLTVPFTVPPRTEAYVRVVFRPPSDGHSAAKGQVKIRCRVLEGGGHQNMQVALEGTVQGATPRKQRK